MINYLELLVVFLLVVPNLLFYFLKKETWYTTKGLFGGIVYFLGQISLILYLGFRQQPGLISIGIDFNRLDLLWVGVLLAILFLVFYDFIDKLFFAHRKQKQEDIGISKEILLSKISLFQRGLLAILVILSAIANELIYRGYFILVLGQRTNSIILCAVISSILFIILHLYFGKKLIPYFVIMTVFYVISVLYTNTILVSVGMHIFINIAIMVVGFGGVTKRLKKESEAAVLSSVDKTIPQEKPIPCSNVAIILFVCSWVVDIISLFLYAIPSILIIVLAVIEMFRIRRSRKKMEGTGFCIAAIVVSTFPMIALAIWFSLPCIFDLLFSM